MKEKLLKAYLAYQMDGGDQPKGRFFHTDPDTGKKRLVEISHDDKNELTLSMKGADAQLLSSLRSDLDAAVRDPLSALRMNDVVVLQAPPGGAPHPGQVFNLSGQDLFFAINGGPIACNGIPLGRDCQARFLNRFPARCTSGGATQVYDQFRLI